jgi:hypothetical protein
MVCLRMSFACFTSCLVFAFGVKLCLGICRSLQNGYRFWDWGGRVVFRFGRPLHIRYLAVDRSNPERPQRVGCRRVRSVKADMTNT